MHKNIDSFDSLGMIVPFARPRVRAHTGLSALERRMEELSQRLGAVAAAPAAAAAAPAADSDAHPDRMRATIERLTARLVRLETVIGCGILIFMLVNFHPCLVSARLVYLFQYLLSMPRSLYLFTRSLSRYIFFCLS